jgi:O-antigen ligase
MSSDTLAARFVPMAGERSPKTSVPLVLAAGVGALLVGIAGFSVSPKLGLLALGLPIAPFFVLAPDKALLLVVAALPFDAVAALAQGSGTLTKLLGMAVMAGWVLHVLLRRHRIQIGRPGFFVLGWITMAILSLMWTPIVGLATYKLKTTLQLVVFYLMVSNLLKDELALKRAVDVWIGASAIVALLVLWQFHSGALLEQTRLQRATLQVGDAKINQNALGAVLALPALAAVVIGRARQSFGWWRWVASIPLGVAMILTGSRGAVVAFAVGVVALATLRPRFGVRAIAAAILIVGMLALIVPQEYADRLSTRFGQASGDRMSGRLDIWAVGMSMIKTRPLLGVGYSGFEPEFYRYMKKTEVDPRWASDRTNRWGRRAAHNIYLTTVAELGVFGGVLLACMFGAHWLAASRARRAGRGKRKGQIPTVALAVSVLLVGLAVLGMTIEFADMKLTWFTLALANAAGLAAGSRPAPRTSPRRGASTAVGTTKELRS